MPGFDNDFSFNIESSETMGNQTLLDDEPIVGNPEDITTITEEDKKKKEQEATKKAPEKKKTEVPSKQEEKENDLIEDILNEDEGKSKDTGKEDEEESDEEGEKEVETTVYQDLYRDLVKHGIFLAPEEGDKEPLTPEEFANTFKVNGQRQAFNTLENFLSQFGDDRKEAFDAIYINGVDPKQYFQAAAQISDYSNLDLTIEANQERIVKDALRELGSEEVDIIADIEKLKQYGDLEATAKRYQKVLVKKSSEKLERLNEEKAAEVQKKKEMRLQYDTSIKGILVEKVKSKDFDGIPVNNQIANQTYDFLLTEKYKTPSGEFITEFDKFLLDLKKPENHPLRVKIALLALNKFDLSKVVTKAVTNESNTIFSTLAKQKSKKTTQAAKAQDNNKSWFE